MDRMTCTSRTNTHDDYEDTFGRSESTRKGGDTARNETMYDDEDMDGRCDYDEAPLDHSCPVRPTNRVMTDDDLVPGWFLVDSWLIPGWFLVGSWLFPG